MADLLQFTCKLTKNVMLSVDAFFDGMIDQIVVGDTELDCIKTIDKAVSVYDNGELTGIYKSPFGYIKPQEFSSGTKSILLVMYRLKHPELAWIPSLESMGGNAKEYLFSYLLNGHIPDFMLYCTTSYLPINMEDFICMDDRGNVGMFTKIIKGMRIREGIELDESTSD